MATQLELINRQIEHYEQELNNLYDGNEYDWNWDEIERIENLLWTLEERRIETRLNSLIDT